MQPAQELANALVAYDPRLAAEVLELVVAELGGPVTAGEADLAAARDFLSQHREGPRLARLGDVADSGTTTEEWKTELRHEARLRELGLALVKLLV